jgi:hypothetical protein
VTTLALTDHRRALVRLARVDLRMPVGKRTLVLLVLLASFAAGLVEVPRADAARKWYWSEAKAESRLKQRYRSVRTATCVGIDARSIFVNGQELHRGFLCYGGLWDGGAYDITLFPRGNRRFIWFRY